MIYLFEDRIERLKQHFHQPLPQNVVLAKFDYEGDGNGLGAYLDAQFPSPQAILFHKSYKGEKLSGLIDKIKDYYLKRKVSFVFFSGGTDIGNYTKVEDAYFGIVNSKVLYQHLELFARQGQDIRVLIFGTSYILNEYLFFLQEVNAFFFSYEGNRLLSPDDKADVQDMIRRHNSTDSALAEIYSELFQWLNPRSENNITINNLLARLQKEQAQVKKLL